MASYQDIFDGVQSLAEAGDVNGLSHFLQGARKDAGMPCKAFRRQVKAPPYIVSNWPIYKRLGLTFKVAHDIAATLTHDGD